MKRREQQLCSFPQKDIDTKQYRKGSEQNPDWEFQKVQSVYQVMKQAMQNTNEHPRNPRSNEFQLPQKNNNIQKVEESKHKSYPQNIANPYQFKARSNNYKPYQQQIPYHPYSKSNTETNVVSDNQSMQYLSSQQPSFLNKQQFTVFDDFNMDNVSPVKKSLNQMNMNRLNENNDWQIASFASPNKGKQNIKEKCILIYQQIQQLKFMKQGFDSKLKQQKVYFTNELQQIKKIFFKLNLKYEKQIIEFSKARTILSRNPSNKSSESNQNQVQRLRQYCRNLEEDKKKSQQKYQNTLKIYQQEIQIISQQLQKRIQKEQNVKYQLQQTQKYRKQKQIKMFQTYQIEIWKNRLKQQQQKHAIAMKRLQQKVFILQQQFEFLQKQKKQNQRNFRQKQKQLVYRQSQIQYRLNQLQKRERQLQMCESVIKKQRQQLERKKQKITDYQLRIIKQERRNKIDLKQKQIMTSQYFNSTQKRRILSKNQFIPPQPQRSDSKSSRSSQIDVNSRLKQIQMMRNNRGRDYQENATSRNSSNQSRFTGVLNSPRNIPVLRNSTSYGSPRQIILGKKQYRPQSNQILKLNQKLSSLTQTIQKQLRQIN